MAPKLPTSPPIGRVVGALIAVGVAVVLTGFIKRGGFAQFDFLQVVMRFVGIVTVVGGLVIVWRGMTRADDPPDDQAGSSGKPKR